MASDAPTGVPFIPYGRHWIDEDDVAAVLAALRSDFLAHGPRVAAFERAFASQVGADQAVACSSGTAALHLALAALDVGPGDLCIVPAITFLATATAVRFCGAEVLFADVDPRTGALTPGLLDAALARAAGPVKAVLPVHLGGRLCDMAGLRRTASTAGAVLVEDACHALGGRDADGAGAGACAHSDAATFSLHPVKTIAAGEGGVVTLNDPVRADRMRRLRNHAVSRDPLLMTDSALSFDADGQPNPWSYEQVELGFNYRMNELEAALGHSQLGKLERFVARRAALARQYDCRLERLAPGVTPAPRGPGAPSLHLYQVWIDWAAAGVSRADAMRRMADLGVGSQVHYIPLYRQPYFRDRYGQGPLPGAEHFYEGVLALPLFPAMSDDDVERVVQALERALG